MSSSSEMVTFPSPLETVFAALTEQGYWYRQITMESGEVGSIHHPPIPKSEASEAPWWVTSRAALTDGFPKSLNKAASMVMQVRPFLCLPGPATSSNSGSTASARS